MSTKRAMLFTKDSISKNNFHQTLNSGCSNSKNGNGKYNQLNLNNQNHKYNDAKAEQFESKTFSNNEQKWKDSLNQNNYCFNETNASHFSMKKKNSDASKLFEVSTKFENFREKLSQCQSMKKALSLNKSTLSLHISAYENSTKKSQKSGDKMDMVKAMNGTDKNEFNKSWKTSDSVCVVDSSSKVQNFFKFQRQQIDETMETAEVMKFKASQKLSNFNMLIGKGSKLLPQLFDSSLHLKNSSYPTNFASIRCFSTLPPSNNSIPQLVPFSSIPSEDLGISILHLKENGFGSMTPTDLLKKGVVFAKMCSLGSSALGVVMIPVLTSRLWDTATERPATMAFAFLANLFLGILTFTPLLLHFLAKRFVVNVFYNADTKVFTTVHYNFFLQKRALRFRAEDVVDSAIAPETKKLWLPLATCFVGGKPLLLSLDRRQYRHEEAFDLLMKNITIPKNHD